MRTWRWQGCRAVAALSVGLLVTLSGCSRGGPPESVPSAAVSEAYPGASDIDQSKVVVATVEVRGTGAAAFAWSGREALQVTRVGREGLDTNLLSVGFMEPKIVPPDRKNRFRFAFDLLNAYGDKPGTFTIDSTPVNQQGLQNQAFLIWIQVKDPTKEAVFEMTEVDFLKEFREVRKPCKVTIGPDVLSGALLCTELATSDGEVASLEVRWHDGEIAPPSPADDQAE